MYEKIIIKIYHILNPARGKSDIDYTSNINLLQKKILSQTDTICI